MNEIIKPKVIKTKGYNNQGIFDIMFDITNGIFDITNGIFDIMHFLF